MINFKVQVTGDEQLAAALSGLERQLRDVRPIWPKVSSTFDDIEKRHFDSLGATGASGAWAALSEPYAKWKAANYPGEPILQLTGNLMRSLTTPFNPDTIFEMTPDTLTRGSKLPYANVHQNRKAGPRRPPIDLTDLDKQKMLKSFRDGFGEAAAQLRFEVIG